jgi:hypothetical protein
VADPPDPELFVTNGVDPSPALVPAWAIPIHSLVPCWAMLPDLLPKGMPA